MLCQVLLTYTGRYWDLGWVPCLALCTAVGTLLLLGYCIKESTAINQGLSFNTWMGVLNPLVRSSPCLPECLCAHWPVLVQLVQHSVA